MTQLQQVPFYYLRHGQTDWNVEKRVMGQNDIPLNSTGINQAVAARSLLKDAGITTICHSPLSRAKMTAEIFHEFLNCPLVEIPELKEFHLGPYTGHIKEQWFQDWRAGAELAGAEPCQDFFDRCLRGVNKSLNLPGTVLIIAHGGVYWAIEHALQVTLERNLGNCEPLFHQPPKQGSDRWTVSFL